MWLVGESGFEHRQNFGSSTFIISFPFLSQNPELGSEDRRQRDLLSKWSESNDCALGLEWEMEFGWAKKPLCLTPRESKRRLRVQKGADSTHRCASCAPGRQNTDSQVLKVEGQPRALALLMEQARCHPPSRPHKGDTLFPPLGVCNSGNMHFVKWIRFLNHRYSNPC